MIDARAKLGFVIIGRNEGERLGECLRSIKACGSSHAAPMIYVDSASRDGSVDVARGCCADVVLVDGAKGLGAARARAAGFDRLAQIAPDIEFVQFIDGDCTLELGWLDTACTAMQQAPHVGAVCGWRRELHPEASIYNRICEREWRILSSNSVDDFGGDVLMRCGAYRAVGGYDPRMIACEDHDLSARLHAAQWTIVRLDQIMTSHDARMTHWWQWWRRCTRRGVGYAQMWVLHRRRSDTRAIARALLWGIAWPIAAVALAPLAHGMSLLMLLAYPLRAARIATIEHHHGAAWREALVWGGHCVAASFPYACGLLRYVAMRALGATPNIIEYNLPRKRSHETIEPAGAKRS